MSTPPSAGAESTQRMMVGELFPADDLIAQWVFSLTAFAEDLQVGIKPAKEAMEEGNLRALLFWQRHTVTRLFEARRLVASARTIEEIGVFLGDLLEKPPTGTNLMEAYTRRSHDSPSMVEALYEQLRHLTVHYSKVGEPELKSTLETYRHLPAEMTITTASDGSPDLQFRWVQAIRSMEVLGDIGQEDFLDAMRRNSQTTGSLTASWMMVTAIAITLHARRLGIDPNRLGDVSGWRLWTARSEE